MSGIGEDVVLGAVEVKTSCGTDDGGVLVEEVETSGCKVNDGIEGEGDLGGSSSGSRLGKPVPSSAGVVVEGEEPGGCGSLTLTFGEPAGGVVSSSGKLVGELGKAEGKPVPSSPGVVAEGEEPGGCGSLTLTFGESAGGVVSSSGKLVGELGKAEGKLVDGEADSVLGVGCTGTAVCPSLGRGCSGLRSPSTFPGGCSVERGGCIVTDDSEDEDGSEGRREEPLGVGVPSPSCPEDNEGDLDVVGPGIVSVIEPPGKVGDG
ncbi:unnamed protein product [Nippostrongylus brasiliensis]|uniref:Uncharacterized protein n=1 Tax=Nippostrongylus brasiliensis TaxID=27835 RepID=A0A0N4YYS8_NIPBR|nr:unnamed protein product [Nippostrongylus brasiliensis]